MQNVALSVIVPYYNETPQELFLILASLNGQLGVDFRKVECILVNDGNLDNALTDDFLSLFRNIRPRCIYLSENKGPGMARQAGIDAAVGEYVMCCDADDSLSNMFAFNAFIDEIERNHPEMILSTWLEEIYDPSTGKYNYSQHDIDYNWMHGKAIKRAFLTEQNIRFHENLRVHEDNYFLALVYAEAEDMRKIQGMTYVWKDRPDSTTRLGDGRYIFETMPDFIRSVQYILEEVERRHPDQMKHYTAQGIINIYFTFQKRNWRQADKAALLKKSEEAFGKMILPYLHYFESTPSSVVAAMYSQEREQSFKNEIETERLEAWLARVTQRGVMSL